MATVANQPILSNKAVEMLRFLILSEKQGDPFQDCKEWQARLRHSLREKDYIVKSNGIDGTVKYRITGRGKSVVDKCEIRIIKPRRIKSTGGDNPSLKDAIDIFFQKFPHKRPIFDRILNDLDK